jgi:hypothetical protein
MMSVKFRLGFTIDAETMFGLMAKLLPIEDLNVEEIRERPHAPIAKLAKPQPQIAKRGRGRRRNATGGSRFAAIRPVLMNGPVHLSVLRQAFKDNNFSHNGLSSAITAWVGFGLIEKVGPGTYQLKSLQ